MPTGQVRRTEHDIEIAAPAASVYRLIADAANWPRIFPPTIHVDHLEHGEREELIRICAVANGVAKTWVSRRVLDPERLRVDFRQEVSAEPVAAMAGSWLIEPLSASWSHVRLLHDFRAVDDDPAQLAWIEHAVDRNSRSELASLRGHVEALPAEGAAFSFVDTVQAAGSAEDVYGFINDAHRWQERLPHVVRAELAEETPGLQVLEMDTLAKDGSVHSTKSYRVCFPHHRIVYKQVTLPALLSLHTGCWTFEEGEHGVDVSSRHTVALNTVNITKVLGPDAGVEEAKDFVRSVLSTNSLITLRHAKDHAEGRR